MSEDQFTRLFKYIEEFRSDVSTRFDTVDTKFRDVSGAIGELSAQVRDYHQEVLIIGHQLDRLREAILQIAKETGVKLSIQL